jgi:glycosyltransferase involved in cell wall biosynthesis
LRAAVRHRFAEAGVATRRIPEVNRPVLDLSVVVPVRNAALFVDDCLASIVRAEPREIIVVDGNSTDRTLDIARRHPVRILSDDGQGVAAARMIGARAASCPAVALIDVDIVLPDGALQALFDEFRDGRYTALQAGLRSTAGPGYWGRALVYHHNNGRSKHWPGVMATIFDRDALLRHGLDASFRSGEDIELRWRLQRANANLGVSQQTIVTHRFDDTFDCARGQFAADGQGLARMVLKYRWRAGLLLAIPAAGAVRGIGLSLIRRDVRWAPYYLAYGALNYAAIAGTFFDQLRPRGGQPRRVDYGQA